MDATISSCSHPSISQPRKADGPGENGGVALGGIMVLRVYSGFATWFGSHSEWFNCQWTSQSFPFRTDQKTPPMAASWMDASVRHRKSITFPFAPLMSWKGTQPGSSPLSGLRSPVKKWWSTTQRTRRDTPFGFVHAPIAMRKCFHHDCGWTPRTFWLADVDHLIPWVAMLSQDRWFLSEAFRL